MKRPHKEQRAYPCAHFPIFGWVQCAKCGVDFRWEWGWRVRTGPYHGPHGVMRYLCTDCAPTRDHAHRVAGSEPWNPRPST